MGVADPVAEGESVGAGYRFLPGVNQANYGSGDERFRVNCLEAVVALHNSVKFGRQFVAGPAGDDRDPARLEVAFGVTARWVAGVAGAEQYVRGGPMGVAVPVVYQRADGSAHVIAAVHAGERGEQGRVVLLDPQKGEEAEAAGALAAVGVWVIPVSGVEVEGEVVLPPGGSGLRSPDGGSGLPAVVTGPKRRGGVSGPVAGKAGAKGTKRTRGEAAQGSREEEVGESSRVSKRRKVQEPAAVGAVSGSPGDGGSDVLTPTEQAAQQDPNEERKRKQREKAADRRRARKVAADRVAVLEALAAQGPLTVEQEAELAELRLKAQQWQKRKERDAKKYQARKAAAVRVVELEALKQQGPLTDEQEAELAELQPKVAQQKQKQKEYNAKRYQEGKAAAARVVELEALKQQGPLTDQQEVELAELRPKAQQRQKEKERIAEWHRARTAASVRVVELEALEGLTEEQEVELVKLRPKAQQWQKKKEWFADWYRAGKAAAVRVAELEALKGRGQLTEALEVELAELRPKAQQWQKKRERIEKDRRAKSAAAVRVAELEALEGLTEEQEVELAELRSRVAGRGREKKDREVAETGVGGAPVVGQGAGPEGVSGWAEADQDARDAWSADVDLDAWLARVVPDEEGVQVPQGAADAGVMLDAGAYEEFVETELLAFRGQDAGDDAAGADGAGSVAGDDDFAVFLDEYGGIPPDGLGLGAMRGWILISRWWMGMRMCCWRAWGWGW
ncbi:hypothetical protein [Saccharopolyspora spinosa]|uniref:hypothetical protein n=1 Tax=Saccharopolyspora spinosa TaxID=60894 RepID=UPI00374A3AF7